MKKKPISRTLLGVLVCQIALTPSLALAETIGNTGKQGVEGPTPTVSSQTNSIEMGKEAWTDATSESTMELEKEEPRGSVRTADSILTGTWGEVTYEFDSETGTVTVTGTGTLGTTDNSPWNREGGIDASLIKVIQFTKSVSAPEDSSYLFSSQSKNKLSNLEKIEGAEFLDTSNVTNMNHMFYGAANITELDVSNFDMSNVTNIGYMFAYASSLTKLDVSKWNVSNVTNMSYMFSEADALTKLDVSKWNVSNVTDMSNTFSFAKSVTELDVSKWDVSNVTNMKSLFYATSIITKLDVSKWNVSNVTDMSDMFSSAENVTELDVSKWDVSNVMDMSGIFRGTYSLTELDLFGWDNYNARYAGSNLMLSGLSSVKRIRVGPKLYLYGSYLPNIQETDVYTGKWKLEGGDKAVTSDELTDNYDGSKDAGTYVWEEKATQSLEVKDSAVYKGAKWEAKDNFVSATDSSGNPVSLDAIIVDGSVDTSKPGLYKVTYKNGSLEKAATIEVKDYLKGDVTNDGKVNLRDVVALQNYLMTGDLPEGPNGVVTLEYLLAVADYNNNGKIDLNDIVSLQQQIMGED